MENGRDLSEGTVTIILGESEEICKNMETEI
jgi:hypothetical protein